MRNAKTSLRGAHVNLAALELHSAVLERENRVIAAQPDIEARLEFGAPLADDDRAGEHLLPAVGFHAAVLGVAVAPVPGRALTFLMCHKSPASQFQFPISNCRLLIAKARVRNISRN